jgi:hypothetical protein
MACGTSHLQGRFSDKALELGVLQFGVLQLCLLTTYFKSLKI